MKLESGRAFHGFTWCVAGSKLHWKLNQGSTIWSLFRSSVIWISWLHSNAIYFAHDAWNFPKVKIVLQDYFTNHVEDVEAGGTSSFKGCKFLFVG